VIYFDTSYLVRLYHADVGAETVRALAASDHVACAALGQAETMAAFHRKLREGAIPPAAYSALLRQFRAHDEMGAFQWLTQDEEVSSRIASVFAKLPPTVFLRAVWQPQPSAASGPFIRMTCVCSVPQNISASRARMSSVVEFSRRGLPAVDGIALDPR